MTAVRTAEGDVSCHCNQFAAEDNCKAQIVLTCGQL